MLTLMSRLGNLPLRPPSASVLYQHTRHLYIIVTISTLKLLLTKQNIMFNINYYVRYCYAILMVIITKLTVNQNLFSILCLTHKTKCRHSTLTFFYLLNLNNIFHGYKKGQLWVCFTLKKGMTNTKSVHKNKLFKVSKEYTN